MSRPKLEVADVVRQYGETFLAHYGHTLSGAQLRALRAIELCRTAALGGHLTECDRCGHQEQAYNSCRHRSCPKCHLATQAAWLANRQREVLDTPYEHAIFTLPQDLSPLVLHNPRLLYGLLFRTVAQSLLDIAGDPKHLGAEIGGMAVLHTWGGQLQHHPHLHCVLPAGGLAPDGSRWIPCRPGFFLPVRVLSRRFRKLYLEGLKRLYNQGQLNLTGRCRELVEAKPWKRLWAALGDIEWVVYAKEPVHDSEHILKYLARYTHRVAISNHRLVALQDGEVTFRFKDYKRRGELRTQTLKAVEFLRRFTLHILPGGLHKIRYFGYFANRYRQAKLAHCRALLGQSTNALVTHATAVGEATLEPDSEGARIEPGDTCPACHQGRMQLVKTYYRHRAAWDLSVAGPKLDTS
jgi:Putative transposase/Transposase zinc-binding domain